jgi:hypothetical protein
VHVRCCDFADTCETSMLSTVCGKVAKDLC